MVAHKGMKISSSEISSFISYVHIIVYEIQVHETATLTFFSGTFVSHLYSNHHEKQEKKKKKKKLYSSTCKVKAATSITRTQVLGEQRGLAASPPQGGKWLPVMLSPP